MKKIVTIGGWNGQSNLLDALYKYFPKDVKISSIVSMSDDGRTTGELMRKFQEELGMHLPPPGDLRRCLFMMSDSKKRNEFQQYMETVIERDVKISDMTVWDYFKYVWADSDFKKHLKKISENGSKSDYDILWFTLPLSSSIKWHKVWNVLMANLYFNLNRDYHAMLEVMHEILEVRADIIPVTTSRAYIQAVLWNGEVIESQDRISNVAAYSSWIADLKLMEDSKHAYQHKDVFKSIKKADFIVISPGDLFTSIISNFVIGGVKDLIGSSEAKIIYIWNTTNKWGETQWLTHLDFINKIERFLWRKIDIFVSNNKHLELSKDERIIFQANVSVKWGDFLYLSDGEKSELERRHIKYFETDLLDRKSFYKHDKKSLADILVQLIA